jgi:hypothetical protein
MCWIEKHAEERRPLRAKRRLGSITAISCIEQNGYRAEVVCYGEVEEAITVEVSDRQRTGTDPDRIAFGGLERTVAVPQRILTVSFCAHGEIGGAIPVEVPRANNAPAPKLAGPCHGGRGDISN